MLSASSSNVIFYGILRQTQLLQTAAIVVVVKLPPASPALATTSALASQFEFTSNYLALDICHQHELDISMNTMTTKGPVKSILKAPKPSQDEINQASAQDSRDKTNRAIALAHAHRIQHQKTTRLRLLDYIEALSTLPSSPPRPADSIKFTTLVASFQPSDFDALIEERSSSSSCGYALCANRPRSLTLGASTASWKLGPQAAAYCSAVCAQKALYVRAQLDPTPVWERDPASTLIVNLLGEDRPAAVVAAPKFDQGKELALERGEGTASIRPGKVVSDVVVERAANVGGFKPMSSVSKATWSSTAIEGYEPRMKSASLFGEDDEASENESETEDG